MSIDYSNFIEILSKRSEFSTLIDFETFNLKVIDDSLFVVIFFATFKCNVCFPATLLSVIPLNSAYASSIL